MTGGKIMAGTGAGTGMTEMAALMGATVEAAANAQVMGLSLLKAEMAALAQMMPGQESDPVTEARRAAEEAEIEAGFDNMPV